MFTGDVMEACSACYRSDGRSADCGRTLDCSKAFNPHAIAPGRGDAVPGNDIVRWSLESTCDFVESSDCPAARLAVKNGALKDARDAVRTEFGPEFHDNAFFEHGLPVNMACACDEARRIDTPRILIAERDRAMRAALQA